MNIHLFWTVAVYEMKTLLRSWFFRIFAILATIFITSFNLAIFLQKQSFFWIYKALGGALPYANLLIVNLGQAIVAIFLASEFLKQDQKNDSVEVIYVRPVSNTAYVLGKFAGILLVFSLFNLFILVLGLAYSFIGNSPVVSIFALLVYPFLISLPTLTFIIGLSFSLMVLIRNQAVVFIITLGYIALSVFYLNDKFYHVFDYIGYNVPMLYSSISGFGNLYEVAVHRGIYLFLGAGLIFFTIYRLNRLPDRDSAFPVSLLFIVLFLSAGAALGVVYIQNKRSFINFRKEVLELNNRYAGKQGHLSVTECDIDLQHTGSTIKAAVALELENTARESLDTLILNLNPSLNIDEVSCDRSDNVFLRDLHLIKIPASPPLQPNEKCNVKITYHGSVNENYAFVDLNEDEHNDIYNFDLLKLRKRAAFINPGFVCLTPATGWYPSAGAGYSPLRPYFKPLDFTRFTLRVRTAPGLTAVSQGQAEESGEGEFRFTPEYPLSQVSVSIGNYIKRSMVVDSIDFSIYTTKGNDYYSEFFEEIKDTLAYQVKDMWSQKQVETGMTYPYRRFSLVEVPVHFRTDLHKWSVASDALQPEIVYYPEKGIKLENADLNAFYYQQERQKKRQGGDLSPEALKIQTFRDAMGNFTHNHFNSGRTYEISPQFYSFVFQLNHDEYAPMDIALQAYLKNFYNWQNYTNKEVRRMPVKQLASPDLERNMKTTSDAVNNMILDKGVFLFKSLGALLGEKEFNRFLHDFISENRLQKVGFAQFDSAFSKKFGRSLETNVDQWYHTNQLPAYVVRNIKKSKLDKSSSNDHLVSFEVSNINPSDGFIDVLLTTEDRQSRWEGKHYIPGLSAKKISLKRPFNSIELKIQTSLAENIPNEIMFDLNMKTETIPDASDTVLPCSYFTSDTHPGELIVDNEDEGFTAISPGNKGFLKMLIEKSRNAEEGYDNHFRHWNPPGKWTRVLESGSYGRFIHSAVYIASGKGDMQALWETPIAEPGYYNIYFYFNPRQNNWSRNNKKFDYNIIVRHDGGTDEIKRYENEFARGWNLLGSYYISTGFSAVTLSNKSEGRVVVGDAVKWEKAD